MTNEITGKIKELHLYHELRDLVVSGEVVTTLHRGDLAVSLQSIDPEPIHGFIIRNTEGLLLNVIIEAARSKIDVTINTRTAFDGTTAFIDDVIYVKTDGWHQ